MQAAGIGLMLADPTPALLFLGCALFGLGVGNNTSLPSVIVQAEFPRAAFGRVVSTIIAINQLHASSSAPGSWAGCAMSFGGYHVAFGVCVALELAAVAILWLGARATPRSHRGRGGSFASARALSQGSSA